ncbi:hypothetical protein UPYG_G00125170 [Umbra pygmaea]|uniref:GP-PDE domain-containing protein n=1 Tax=Umbra pygmaea TaxID=75934 RepID=A0ABD0X6M0_UMBPY
MAPSSTTLSKLKLGKLRVVRRRLLQRYEHQPFVSCLAGLYGCQWRRYQRTRATPGDCCCSKVECASFLLLIVAFCLTLVFLYFWTEAQNDYNDFDWLYLHWVHKIGILMSLAFSIVATAVLSDLWRKQWTTLILSFQVTAPYLHVGGVFLMTLLSWPIALHFFHSDRKVGQVLVLGLYLVVLCALYMVPLGMYSPCLKDKDTLGPAPALIGHRGAPMLAPENTVMSFEKAVEAGGDGLETDVTISYDGIPFLMHDRTLKRTTNVREVFPNRTDTPAAMFTWAELQTLNAGAWFLQSDPFGTVRSLGVRERAQVQNQSVCTLRDFLELAAQKGKQVIFDLYRPPWGHPYRDTWITRTLEVIQNESSILSQQVLWLPPDLRSMVQEMDPDLQQTSGSQAPVQELQQKHIVQLNLHYSAMSPDMISNYAAANISTNLYVISQPWLYSLAWCCRVPSVTTNSLQLLNNLKRPLFLMTPDEYNTMWVLTDVVSFILIVLILIFHWWRERGLAFCSSNKPTLDQGTYSKFRTEMSDVWSVSSANVLGEPARGPLAVQPNLTTVSEQ